MGQDEVVDHRQYADLLSQTVRKCLDELRERENPPAGAIPPSHRHDEVIGFAIGNNSYVPINCIEMVYLRQLIQRQLHKGNDILGEYANFIAQANVDFRSYLYQDTLNIFRAFFTVELIYKCTNGEFVEENDPVFLRGEILQDNVLMISIHENLPFSHLKKLFQASEEKKNSYMNVVARFMEQELCLGPIYVDKVHPSCEEAEHLPAFLRNMWVTSSQFGNSMFVNIDDKTKRRRRRVIQNASELQRAGIQFKSVRRPTFDIRFRRGILEIPTLTIISITKDLLQAFISYERKSSGKAMLIVTDYCVVMDCLIQSPQDVQLLRESGVIESYLNDDKDVVKLFDEIGRRAPSTDFCYSDLFEAVNKHCVQRWNSWKAKFRRNYFRDDNQLEVVSFMFAIYIILPFTILQTVYSVLSYYKG